MKPILIVIWTQPYAEIARADRISCVKAVVRLVSILRATDLEGYIVHNNVVGRDPSVSDLKRTVQVSPGVQAPDPLDEKFQGHHISSWLLL